MPGGTDHRLLPSLKVMTSLGLIRVWHLSTTRRMPFVMTVLRYGSCSVSLIGSGSFKIGERGLMLGSLFLRGPVGFRECGLA